MTTAPDAALAQAEQRMLGAMMFHGSHRAATVLDIAAADDLTDTRHRLIFRALVDLIAQHRLVDADGAIRYLTEEGQLDEAGGAPYINHVKRAYEQYESELRNRRHPEPTVREYFFVVCDLRGGRHDREGFERAPGAAALPMSAVFGPPPWSLEAGALQPPSQEQLDALAEYEAASAAWREPLAKQSQRSSGNNAAPIATAYAGCRFRSRLEARHAVMFDALNIEWEYEPQGFVVDGKPYLPDFRLPDLRLWVEIKPEMVEDPRHDAFAATLEDDWNFVVSSGGIPDPRDLDNWRRRFTGLEEHLLRHGSTRQLKDAYAAARSARFEHGESGA